MKKICIMFVLLGALYSMVGCNTVKGAGEDIEQAGDAVKDATN
jgi:predicted small secreted protein